MDEVRPLKDKLKKKNLNCAIVQHCEKLVYKIITQMPLNYI